MKKSFSEAMGEISEKHIDEALSIDSKEALDQAKQSASRRRGNLIRKIALPAAACLCIVLAGALVIRPFSSAPEPPDLVEPQPGTAPPETGRETGPADNTTPEGSQNGAAQTEPVLGADPGGEVQIPNPMQDLGTPEAVGEAMGHAFPVLPGRTPETCTVIQYGPVPAMGRVSYTDGTELAIGPAGEDISGIYGGELVEECNVEEITVSIFAYGDQTYALWDQDGYAWCWYAAEGDRDTAGIQAAVQEAVTAIQG